MLHDFRLARIALPILATLLPTGPASAGKFYKCTNEQGELVYQQVACDSDIKQETVHVFTAPEHRSQLGPKLMGQSEYIAEGEEPATTGKLRFQSRLSQAISVLNPIKFAVEQYYRMNGVWPENPQDMGFNQENLKSSEINEVLMGDQGAIVAWLSNDFGTEKKVVLAPKLVMDGTSLEWRCLANFPAQSMSMAGMILCESRSLHR